MKEQDERIAKAITAMLLARPQHSTSLGRFETRYLTAVVAFVSDNNKNSTHPRTWVT